MVHTDDVLFLCKTNKELQRIYNEFTNFLHSVALQPNLAKVQEGRFATAVLDYCGYRFAGGYVTISHTKIDAFKEGVQLFCVNYTKDHKLFIARGFIKTINQKINGYGHYYKCGSVGNTFERLDGFIRAQIRLLYKKMQLPVPSNASLEQLGLRSLLQLKKGKKQHLIQAKIYKHNLENNRKQVHENTKETNKVYMGYAEQLVNQNSEIITQLKILNKNITALRKTIEH